MRRACTTAPWAAFVAATCAGAACSSPFGEASRVGADEPRAASATATDGSDAGVDGGIDAGDEYYVSIAGTPATWRLPARDDGLGSAQRDGGPTELVRMAASQGRDLRCGRVEGATRWTWFCVRVRSGVLVGRAVETAPRAPAPRWSVDYRTAFAGWSARVLDAEGATRVFEVALDDGRHARLRIGASTGRFKTWSSSSAGALGEEFERDLVVAHTGDRFVATPSCAANDAFRIEGDVVGRRVRGRLVRADGSATQLDGERAEVLGQGLEARTPALRDGWQARTRERIRLLALGGDPAPGAVKVDVLQDRLAPLPHTTYSRARDDDPDDHPPDYVRSELRFTWSVDDPWSGARLSREAHAWLLVPNAPAPAAGRPALLSLNGHTGSAHRSTNPDDLKYWFAEAFARRGYVVLALDMGHRDLASREGLYADYTEGDDPAGGNGLHPALAVPGEPSAFEEMGERAWDAEHAAAWLRALEGVDAERTFVMGHSMGGEVALWAAALDPSLGAVVSSGFAGDYGVMSVNGAHPCFRWVHSDVRAYIDASDLAALAAPRPLVVMQGALDTTYSALSPPHGQAREFFRRAALAWGVTPTGDAPGGLVGAPAWFYLHDDEHFVHTADLNPTEPAEPRGLTFSARPRPRDACDTSWQTDGAVVRDPRTLFDLVAEVLR